MYKRNLASIEGGRASGNALFTALQLEADQPDPGTVDIIELSRASGLSWDDLQELVEYSALVPLSASEQDLLFSASCVVSVRTVARLRADFDLDLFTAGMLLGYIEQIRGLECTVRALQARMSGFKVRRPES
ncbi:MAG: chaperone modulator CbpM [Burkholderiaceae bacterium]|nr:chaperone modulator CbpM [Burkholderiaceae bacterium]